MLRQIITWFFVALLPLAGAVGCAPVVQSGREIDIPIVTAPDDESVRPAIERALNLTFHGRKLTLRDNAAWQIMHGALAFKQNLTVERENGEAVRVIEYLLQGGRMKGWEFEAGDMFPSVGRRGLRAILEEGSKIGQGHPDQWLGYLSDCGLLPGTTIRYGTEQFTVEDYLRQIEWDVPRNLTQEYSWTLMALTAYHPTSYEWTASDGHKWSIGRLMDIEAEHELESSACGGTHRLVGLTLALNRHLAKGGVLEGPWKAADDKIQESLRRAREWQNPDGSLSANYFSRPGHSPDLAQALGTTGHTLEFAVLATTSSEFKQPWIRNAASRLCELFVKTREIPIECGALYHAANSLVIYYKRAYNQDWTPDLKAPQSK